MTYRLLFSSFVRASVVSAAFVAAACSQDASTEGPASEDALTSAAPAKLVFAADGSMTKPKTLVEGGLLQVTYELARHAPCDGRPDELGITDDHGHTTSFFFSDQLQTAWSATIVVPAGNKLALWVRTSPWEGHGGSCWDSNGGKNFELPIAANPHPEPVITFAADGSVHPSGALVPGAVAQVRYSQKRTGCPVTAGILADGAASPPAIEPSGFVQVPTTASHGDGEPYSLFTFTVPHAKHVSLWFHVNLAGFESPPTCSSQWDSNGGKNFTFDVAP